jgi:uroporphyrinogen decarboxylase
MTPRERVLRAINHQEPDRIPISFGGTMSSGILECPPTGRAYSRLCTHLGIVPHEPPDFGFMNNYVSNIDERILCRFGSDFRRIDPNGPDLLTSKDGSRTVLGIYCGLRVKNGGVYDDVFEYPLWHAETLRDIRDYPYWPQRGDFQRLAAGKAEEARQLQAGDYAVVVDTFLVFPFLMYPMLTGFEKWLIDMKSNSSFYFALADRLLEVGLDIIGAFLGAVGPCVNVVCTYDDVGTQRGLTCSRQDYMQFIQPYEKQIIDRIKKVTDAVVYRHSCGSVYELIPDFIEMGIQILNPVQPLAWNMEPWRLKREFGKDLCFFGGVDTQELLPHAAPPEIEHSVVNLIRDYGSGGGFVLAPSSNIEPDTPPENVVALYEAALRHGAYPLRTSENP